mgnify:CR=1 FL=1|tara:strand:+ start:43398 stop:47438 length:4041 start_codon:yes stop_codon:yes gene_type:complete
MASDKNKNNIRKAVRELGIYVGEIGEHQFVTRLLQLASISENSDPALNSDALKAMTSDNTLSRAPGSDLEHLVSKLVGLTDGGTRLQNFIEDCKSFIAAPPEGSERSNTDSLLVDRIKGVENRLWTVTFEEIYGEGQEFCGDAKISSIIGTGFNKNVSNPTKDSPNIGTIQFHNSALNFSNRSTGIASVFMNMLPTTELSKCQPFVDIKVITFEAGTETEITEGDASQTIGDGISLLRFLMGKAETNEVGAAYLNARPINADMPSQIVYGNDGRPLLDDQGSPVTEEKPVTVAGMEVFTSPQTLINGNEPHYDVGADRITPGGRNTSVIDRMRPFMTFKSFDVSVQPARGMISTKSATIQFTLHDRSRLSEVSQLVTPEGLADVELMIEYGWSHPEGSNSKNSFATMLNSLRTKEKFQVVNSGLSFNEVGEVDITMKLVSKGNRDLNFKMITDDEIPQTFDEVKKIFRQINKLKRSIRSDLQQNEEMVGEQVMGKANSVSAIRSMSPEDATKLRKLIATILKNPKSSAEYEELASGFESAMTKIKSLDKQINKTIKQKMSRVRYGPDPYAKACPNAGIELINGRAASKKFRTYSNSYLANKYDAKIAQDAEAQFDYEEGDITQAEYGTYAGGNENYGGETFTTFSQVSVDEQSAGVSSQTPFAEAIADIEEEQIQSVFADNDIEVPAHLALSGGRAALPVNFEGADEGYINYSDSNLALMEYDLEKHTTNFDLALERFMKGNDVFNELLKTEVDGYADLEGTYGAALALEAQQRQSTALTRKVLKAGDSGQIYEKLQDLKWNFAKSFFEGVTDLEQEDLGYISRSRFNDLAKLAIGLDDYVNKNNTGSSALKSADSKKMSRTQYTSFARVALEFIAKPLASAHKFDEIQMCFYPMNSYSTFARDDDVGSFPIPSSVFEKQLKERLKKNPNLTIAAFVGFMNRNFFSNLATDIYGFKSIYTRDPETAKAQLRKKYKENKKNKVKLPDMKKAIFKKAYGPNSEQKFVKPQIQMYLEAVPGNGTENGGEAATILRIHFFDKAATSYRGFSDLWESLRSGSASMVNTKAVQVSHSVKRSASKAPQASTRSGHGEQWAQQLALLKDLDIIEAVDSSGRTVEIDQLYNDLDDEDGRVTDQETIDETTALLSAPYVRIKGGPAGLRYLFHRNMPSIKYGSTYSAVLKANLATQQDNKMATIHMQRANKSKKSGPSGDIDDGLPLRTFPASLTVEMYGCPFINFGQQYFIDFATGTTVDDIYAVNEITHRFKPGEFTTSVKFIPMMKYGQYQSLIGNLSKMANDIRSLNNNPEEPKPKVKGGTSKPHDPRTDPVFIGNGSLARDVMVNPDSDFF